MNEKLNLGGLPATRRNYTSTFRAGCMRQVAAGTRQTDVACAQGISSALLGRWQRQTLEQAVPSSAERAEINRLRAELKRVEMARYVKKGVPIFSQPPPSGAATRLALPRTVARASARPRAGRQPRRLLPVAGPCLAHARSVAGGSASRLCTPRAMRWDATPCALGCTGTGCGR